MAMIGLSDPLDARRRLAEALIKQGTDYSPVQDWTQGAARIASVLAGGLQRRSAEREQKAQSDLLLKTMLGGSSPSAEPMRLSPPAMPSSGSGDAGPYGDTIAGIESAGSGDYSATGPVTKSGDRAYGRYGVMGANVPAWTKAHYGVSMTPEDFLKSPEAQDAVFKGQFGQYVQKYGPEGAARAWFAGEGGMDDPNRKDVLGTSVADYSRKFSQAAPGPAAPAGAVQIPPEIQQKIGQLWQAGPAGQRMAMELYAQYSKPQEPPGAPETKTIFDEQGREITVQFNPQSGQWEQLGGAAPETQPASVQEYEYYANSERQAGREPVGWMEYLQAKKNGFNLQVGPDGSVSFSQGGAGGKPFTEAQSKDVVYVTRATGALPTLDKMGDALTRFGEATGGNAPLIGNYLKSPEYQQAEQAGLEFLQAILRKDTGAAITPQETAEYGKVYLPRPGDSPQVLEQKRLSRRRAIEAIRLGLPPEAILKLEKGGVSAPDEAAPTPSGAQNRVRRYNPDTGMIE